MEKHLSVSVSFLSCKKKVFPEAVSIDFSVFPIIYNHVTWVPTTERRLGKKVSNISTATILGISAPLEEEKDKV